MRVWILLLPFLTLAAAAAAQNRNPDLALIDAARSGDAAQADALLRAGANPKVRGADSVTALIAAAYGGHNGIARLLVAAGAEIDAEDRTPQGALMIACVRGNVELVRLLVKAGANVDASNQFGGNCIIPAAERGHVEVVREMLATTKINVNHVNRLGWTALLEAIILSDGGPRHVEIVRLLLAHGADANLADKDGVTPLAHARRRGYRAIKALLVASGAK
ncbi:MAG: ankyrin repeat domain-containing protein [Alphaproteobacteria bacterium]